MSEKIPYILTYKPHSCISRTPSSRGNFREIFFWRISSSKILENLHCKSSWRNLKSSYKEDRGKFLNKNGNPENSWLGVSGLLYSVDRNVSIHSRSWFVCYTISPLLVRQAFVDPWIILYIRVFLYPLSFIDLCFSQTFVFHRPLFFSDAYELPNFEKTLLLREIKECFLKMRCVSAVFVEMGIMHMHILRRMTFVGPRWQGLLFYEQKRLFFRKVSSNWV